MKKLVLVSMLVFLGLGVSSALEARHHSNSWKLEGLIGPNIDIRNWGGHQFAMDFHIGKGDMLSGLLGFAFAGANSAQIKPGIGLDIPFYFTFSSPNDFAVGPSFNAGPRFGFGGDSGTAIDFMNIEFGAKTSYRITNSFGVVAKLVNFSMSFAQWASGVGTSSGFAMSYNMRFGVFYLF